MPVAELESVRCFYAHPAIMIRVCPNPSPWAETYKRLERAWRSSGCHGDAPPIPLILSGWHYSSDCDKQHRWQQTVEWAERHDFSHLIPELGDTEFYFTEHLSTSYPEQHFRLDRYTVRERPSSETLATAMQALKQQWSAVAGAELSDICSPIEFSGRKARRLVVAVTGDLRPPWGDWSYFPRDADRRSFTEFRRRINRAIAPACVDHVDFILSRST